MDGNFTSLCEELQEEIKNAYTSEISLTKAEKLAAKFLYGQMEVSKQLQTVDLDSRMKKSGVKAVKAGVYMEVATATDKKPSDTFIEQVVNKHDLVNKQQDSLDTAEVDRDTLERYYNIFREAHIYFRGMAKQSFGG